MVLPTMYRLYYCRYYNYGIGSRGRLRSRRMSMLLCQHRHHRLIAICCCSTIALRVVTNVYVEELEIWRGEENIIRNLFLPECYLCQLLDTLLNLNYDSTSKPSALSFSNELILQGKLNGLGRSPKRSCLLGSLLLPTSDWLSEYGIEYSLVSR